MQTVYRFNIGETGVTYTSQIVGSVLGMFVSLYCDKLYHRDFEKRGPEARMWTGCAGGILFPLGCWWWTWTAYASVHWIVPLIGVAILYAGLLLVYLTGRFWSLFRSRYIAECSLISLQLRIRRIHALRSICSIGHERLQKYIRRSFPSFRCSSIRFSRHPRCWKSRSRHSDGSVRCAIFGAGLWKSFKKPVALCERIGSLGGSVRCKGIER